MFEIARDVIQAHIEIETYWYFVLMLDSTLVILGLILFYTLYMIVRKQLRIRDNTGRDEWIGLIMSVKKCEITPGREKCRFLIKFRRRSWFFWMDLIIFQKLYYMPQKDQRPSIERKLRKAYVTGDRLDHRELQNYYYLRQGEPVKGKYELAGDYIVQGDRYTAHTTKSVQLAIQADAELASRCWHVDTVALMIPGLDKPRVTYGRDTSK